MGKNHKHFNYFSRIYTFQDNSVKYGDIWKLNNFNDHEFACDQEGFNERVKT